MPGNIPGIEDSVENKFFLSSNTHLSGDTEVNNLSGINVLKENIRDIVEQRRKRC